jgi:hypothetical protein
VSRRGYFTGKFRGAAANVPLLAENGDFPLQPGETTAGTLAYFKLR